MPLVKDKGLVGSYLACSNWIPNDKCKLKLSIESKRAGNDEPLDQISVEINNHYIYFEFDSSETTIIEITLPIPYILPYIPDDLTISSEYLENLLKLSLIFQ